MEAGLVGLPGVPAPKVRGRDLGHAAIHIQIWEVRPAMACQWSTQLARMRTLNTCGKNGCSIANIESIYPLLNT